MLTLSLCPRLLKIAFSIAATLGLPSLPAIAQHYVQANLSSDQSAVASHIDPHLVNPWGLARGGGSAWYLTDNANGLVSIYDSLGAPQSLSVSIPAGDPTQNPTGAPTGVAYNGGPGFELAPGKPARASRLVWCLPPRTAPSLASGDFGLYSHDLLIGQFGSGNVAAYDPVTGNFKGLLKTSSNTLITIPGLWGLSFASGTVSGSSFSLYFTAGPARETHGLFGTIRPYDPDNIFGSSN